MQLIINQLQKNKNMETTSLNNVHQKYSSIYVSFSDELSNYLTYKYGDQEMAKDIVQECFLKLWIDIQTKTITNYKGYLFIMAKNMYLNNIKHQKIRDSYNQYYKHINSNNTLDTENDDDDIKSIKLEKLLKVVNTLPAKEKEVFMMNKLEGYKQSDIATYLDISIKTVEKRMSNAHSIIRKTLGINK